MGQTKPWSIRRLLENETRTPAEIRDAVYLFAGNSEAKQSRFWLLLVLATGIATAGVLADSTATVIGAMIIAPLAIPIQGVAVAIAFGEARALARSAMSLSIAILVVIGLAAILAWLLPEVHPLTRNSQITGRVSPTVIDLVAAAVTGLAGAVAIARRDIGDILPGVAIAISLVPPLAVVGVTVVSGDWSGALGALLLFLTNMLAIIVGGILVFGALGFRREAHSGPGLRPAYSVVAIASVVVVGALVAATLRTVQLSNWQQAASATGETWATKHGEKLILARFHGNRLVLLVEGDSDGSHDPQLRGLLHGEVPAGTPIVVNRVDGESKEIGDVLAR